MTGLSGEIHPLNPGAQAAEQLVGDGARRGRDLLRGQLAAAVRPLTWEKHEGRPLNRRLYLPEYCFSAHDPSFGREMDLPLVMAALMNRWGEDILPEEVAYAMEDNATRSTGNAAFAAAAAGCCGFPCWQAWMDLQDLRTQIHDDCPVAVRVERRIRGQRDPVGI